MSDSPVSITSAANQPQAGELGFLGTGRGKLTLLLLCMIAFLDLIDASITNVALPAIRKDLDFTVQSLQWVTSGYLLTYGGFMLLGGRFADLLGRRRILVAGTVVFGIASITCGLAWNSGVLVTSRFVQGAGAAMMLPAAMSILTTSFQGTDRHKALGVWGGVAGAASAVGVLMGGVLTDGPGWRWVFLVNPPIAALVLVGAYLMFGDDKRTARLSHFDIPGAILAVSGMMLLVYTLTKAPDVGWDAGRTVSGFVGAAVILALFLVNESRVREPLVSLPIFRVRGLGVADITQLVAMAGFMAMFFFLSLYMVTVLHYSPLKTGSAYLPLTVAVGVGSGMAAQLIQKIGTRPIIIAGLLIAATGLWLLSRAGVDGHYVSDLLPGLVVNGFGLGLVFVAVTTAANAGVSPDKAGLAASLLSASQQIGGSLGLAVFTAIATSRTNDLLAGHVPPPLALTEGFQRALFGAALFLVAAAVIAVRASNSRGEVPTDQDAPKGAQTVPAAS